MNTQLLKLALASVILSSTTAYGGLVTLIAEYNDGTNNVAELSIGPYENAEVISFPQSINGSTGSYLYVVKDNKTFTYFTERLTSSVGPGPLDPLIVAGPATLRLRAPNTGSQALCTIRVTPEAFPPDRTILVPPGTNQACISLQCSTNLVQWYAATNGIYGPLPEAKFFRIKLEPVH